MNNRILNIINDITKPVYPIYVDTQKNIILVNKDINDSNPSAIDNRKNCRIVAVNNSIHSNYDCMPPYPNNRYSAAYHRISNVSSTKNRHSCSRGHLRKPPGT